MPADRQAAFEALKEGDKVNRNDNAFSNVVPLHRRAEHRLGERRTALGGACPAHPGGGGSGGLDGTLIPAVTGVAALLLIGAGVTSFVRSRPPRGGPQVVEV